MRRLLVVVVALALLVAVSAGALRFAAWVRDTIRSQDVAGAASGTRTVYPQAAACAATDLSAQVSVPATVAVGAGATFEVTITNTGTDACLLDTGSPSLAAVVVSGQETIWSSATCPDVGTAHELLVDVGDSATSSLVWNGNASGGSCATPDPGASPSGDAASAAAGAASPGSTPEATPEATAASPGATASPGTPDATASSTDAATLDAAAAADGGRVATAGTYRVTITLGGQNLTSEQAFVVE